MATRLSQTAGSRFGRNMSTVRSREPAQIEGYQIRQLAILTAVASWMSVFLAVKLF